MVTAAYAFSHFAVDFACAFIAFSSFSSAADAFLLYNFFAFAMQMPIGLLADLLNKNKVLSLTGIVLIGNCCYLPNSLILVCLLGIGNALFHIGAGLDVLNISGKKATPLGLFVSPGALGVYAGTALGKAAFASLPVMLLLLLSCIAIVCLCTKDQLIDNQPIKLPAGNQLPAILLFAVVLLRSYGGLSVQLPKGGTFLALGFVFAVAAGKAAGGILSDLYGSRKTSLFSLSAAALLFLFSHHPAAAALALLAFNMSMPITLHALALRMPGAKGFSFGLLTFGLFLGFLPAYFGANSIHGTVMSLVCIGSCALLLPGLKAGDQA